MISPEHLLDQIDRSSAPRVLDVRSRCEYLRGHIPGALHLPFWTAWAKAHTLPGSPADPLVVYCGHGPRARLAGAALRQRGFTNVTYLKGDMAGWRKSGFRKETGPPTSLETSLPSP